MCADPPADNGTAAVSVCGSRAAPNRARAPAPERADSSQPTSLNQSFSVSLMRISVCETRASARPAYRFTRVMCRARGSPVLSA